MADGVDKVVFTVNLGDRDVTDRATIIIISEETGEEEILDYNLWTTEKKGEYTAVAQFDNKTSNNVTVSAATAAPLVLAVDKSVAFVGDRVNFIVTQDGEDLSDTALICEREGGVCLMAPYIEPMTPGTYSYYAHLDGSDVESNTVEIEVLPANETPKFQKAVAFFTMTGSWCPPCGGYKNALNGIKETEGGKIVIVNFYTEQNSSTPVANTIALNLFREASDKANGRYDSDIAEQKPGTTILSYVPTTLFDMTRTMVGGNPNPALIMPYYNSEKVKEARTGIQVLSKINGNKVEVEATIMAETAGTYAIGAYLVEDNVVYSQSGQGSAYNHVDVLRAKGMNSIFGDAPEAMVAGDVKTKTFTFDAIPAVRIGANKEDVPIFVHKNLSVVVYTTYEKDGDFFVANIVKTPADGFTGYKLAE
jgi:thiol-disulfide isomerase/thioredoxin